MVAGINAARTVARLSVVRASPRRGIHRHPGGRLDHQGVPRAVPMFTSRAEHRLLLRIDNADLRLTPRGREVGLVDDERWERFMAQAGEIRPQSRGAADTTRVRNPSGDRVAASQHLRQPEIRLEDLAAAGQVSLEISAMRRGHGYHECRDGRQIRGIPQTARGRDPTGPKGRAAEDSSRLPVSTASRSFPRSRPATFASASRTRWARPCGSLV